MRLQRVQSIFIYIFIIFSYNPTIELLDRLDCSHVAHGDDLVIDENGQDAYMPFKRAGRMKIFKRTEGISTTDIVGRLLLLTKETNWEEKVNI